MSRHHNQPIDYGRLEDTRPGHGYDWLKDSVRQDTYERVLAGKPARGPGYDWLTESVREDDKGRRR